MMPIRWRSTLAWLLRLGIVVAALQATGLPGVYVTLGPPQIVETRHPTACVHTRLIDEVETWKIQRSLQLVREMGAPTIVEFFPWAYIEADKGRYDWSHSDLIVTHARQQGLTIIARLGLVPEWAFPETDDPATVYPANLLTADLVDDYAAFVEAFARHYQGQISAIIVWNEPNLSFEWGYQPVDPQRYVDLLKAVYPAAHHGNPDVVVLGGALAPTLEPVGSPFGMNDLDYLRRIYALGAGKYFDALSVHAYGLKFPPDDPPAPEALNFRRVELIRQIMVESGDVNKAVYVTESGWNDHPRWTKAVRPGQRIAYTIGALEYAETHWSWAKNVCIWAFRYPAPTRSYPDYYQLVTPDFTRLPIYDVLKAWARADQQP